MWLFLFWYNFIFIIWHFPAVKSPQGQIGFQSLADPCDLDPKMASQSNGSDPAAASGFLGMAGKNDSIFCLSSANCKRQGKDQKPANFPTLK